jgi:hypothetical protein
VRLAVSILVILFAAVVCILAFGLLIMGALDNIESLRKRAPWFVKVTEKRESLVALLLLCVLLLVGNGYELLEKEIPELPAPLIVQIRTPPPPAIEIQGQVATRTVKVPDIITSPSILSKLTMEEVSSLVASSAKHLDDLSRDWGVQDRYLSEMYWESEHRHLSDEQLQRIRNEGNSAREQLRKKYLSDVTDEINATVIPVRVEMLKRLEAVGYRETNPQDSIMEGWLAKAKQAQTGDDFPVGQLVEYLEKLSKRPNAR